jgi:hypothetical protein
MKTITISESEYFKMQQTVENLQQQLKLLQNQLKWHMVSQPINQTNAESCINFNQPVSIKRGSAKTVITDVAEDFTVPLQDFQDYLS